ncbi:MAG: hypothetical protein M1454_02905 [Candidatus Thermoplasmatota archaeon]|nr:hypothetical protein [Candidatus Thermoplasmatota archaeon]MCL5730796.1 hypothetical protein [Candidatus Thermoplasmatota archaeon]
MAGFLSRLFGSGKKKQRDGDTIVEVKRVEDIPPMIEANRLVLNQDYRGAIFLLFRSMKGDFIRSTGFEERGGLTNRQFLVEGFQKFGIKPKDDAYTDNYYLKDVILQPPALNEDKINQYNALRKLTNFYIDYYERAAFSLYPLNDPDKIIEKASEFYSFLNIVALYFGGGS